MTVWLSVVLSRTVVAVADPDLQIGGWGGGGSRGGGHPDPEIRGGGQAPWTPPLDPPLC